MCCAATRMCAAGPHNTLVCLLCLPAACPQACCWGSPPWSACSSPFGGENGWSAAAAAPLKRPLTRSRVRLNLNRGQGPRKGAGWQSCRGLPSMHACTLSPLADSTTRHHDIACRVQPLSEPLPHLPLCHLPTRFVADLEAGCVPPHLPKIPVLIVCPDNTPSFGWQLDEGALYSMDSTHSMLSVGSSASAACAACAAAGKGGTKGACSACGGMAGAAGGVGEAGPSAFASPGALGAGTFPPAPFSAPAPTGGELELQPGSQASQLMQPSGAAAAAPADAPSAAAAAPTAADQPAGEGPAGPASDPVSALLVPHLAAALAAMPVGVVPIGRQPGSRQQQGDDEVWPPRPVPPPATAARTSTARSRRREFLGQWGAGAGLWLRSNIVQPEPPVHTLPCAQAVHSVGVQLFGVQVLCRRCARAARCRRAGWSAALPCSHEGTASFETAAALCMAPCTQFNPPAAVCLLHGAGRRPCRQSTLPCQHSDRLPLLPTSHVPCPCLLPACRPPPAAANVHN